LGVSDAETVLSGVASSVGAKSVDELDQRRQNMTKYSSLGAAPRAPGSRNMKPVVAGSSVPVEGDPASADMPPGTSEYATHPATGQNDDMIGTAAIVDGVQDRGKKMASAGDLPALLRNQPGGAVSGGDFNPNQGLNIPKRQDSSGAVIPSSDGVIQKLDGDMTTTGVVPPLLSTSNVAPDETTALTAILGADMSGTMNDERAARKAKGEFWYLALDNSERDLSFNMDNVIIGGTFAALVERLTIHTMTPGTSFHMNVYTDGH
jgi:hypothetical protein